MWEHPKNKNKINKGAKFLKLSVLLIKESPRKYAVRRYKDPGFQGKK
jgi:hypothetical protein